MTKAHFHVEKPWGSFDQYSLNEVSTVKILTLNPGEILSLQSHENRDELWVSLNNGLVVEIDGKEFFAKKMSEFSILRRTKHRLKNPGDKICRVMEVSFGFFDENDIIRYEDKYKRV